jgi:hypothetical protein
MDKQLTLLEGQSGSIKVKPTFEGKAAADKVELSQSLSNADILQLTSAPVASENNTVATVAVKVGAIADLTGNLVFKYTGNESEVENIGISTKEIGIKVNAAQLATQEAPSPTKFKYTPGAQLVINVLYKNGDENLENTDPHLNLSVGDSVLELVSRDATGVTLKIKDDADPATAPGVLQLLATYYSGSSSTDLTLVAKPNLTIETTPLSLTNGENHAFPVVVKKGDDDITSSITNIQATADEYFTVDANGNITVIKADTAEVQRTIHYTFDYTEDGLTWTYTADVTATIAATETPDQFSLTDVSTPLTMDLWAKQTLSYKVMDGETDVTSSVTSVTVSNADAIKDKFEVTQDGVTTTFQSVSSSSTEQVTATANVVIAGTYNGQEFSLPADINLVTNVNDGSIPTNRFDVQMDQ